MRSDPFAAVVPDSHPLSVLSDKLEEATDNLVTALNNEAVAQNAYLKELATELIYLDAPVTIRLKLAEAKVVDSRAMFNLAHARAEGCKAKCHELRDRLSAMQSLGRIVQDQT